MSPRWLVRHETGSRGVLMERCASQLDRCRGYRDRATFDQFDVAQRVADELNNIEAAR